MKQKKVTNAYLAKLLGWEEKKSISFRYWFEPGSGKSYFKPPDFLHSLDATVKECERLGVVWELCSRTTSGGKYMARLESSIFYVETGAALSLATALARYLESRVA